MTTPSCEAGRAPDPSLPFEEALQELETVLRRLEEGQDRLEETLRLYERGVVLLQHCRELLQQAEAKVQQLTGIDEQGRPRLEPFAHTSRLAQARQEWDADTPEQDRPLLAKRNNHSQGEPEDRS
jgi:exodeoxyribonuclease VII small subunit